MPKVSIVMPLYNQQNYIVECLKSVQNQTLKDIEIIVVDDSSTDNSVKIVKKIAEKDKRIRIITKPNKGYGHSMNVGFDAATGEYIGIVETDDFVDSHMFEDLYNAATKYNCEIVKSNYYKFKSCGKTLDIETILTAREPENYNKIFNPVKDKQIFHFEINTWTGIYKTSFIRENKIRHNETPGASYQDNGFWFQTISQAKRILFLNKAYYYYRQDNPNSSINSKAKIFCMCDEYKFIREFISNHKDIEKEMLHDFTIRRFWNYYYTYQRIGEQYKLTFLKRFAEDFNEILNKKELNISKIDAWMANTISRIVVNPEAFYYEDLLYNKQARLGEKRAELQSYRDSKYLKVFKK